LNTTRAHPNARANAICRPGGVSSRGLRQEFPDLRRHYWRANQLWSASYFAGSVGGAPVSTLHQYIEQQNQPA
jgi:putative transposase